MRKSKTGLLVSFDGSNGSGKSTIIEEVFKKLSSMYTTIKTKEPTESYFGNLVRNAENKLNGRSYACLIAADRYFHIESLINKELENDKIVLSDRYVASSLILQSLDGVSMDFVWNINEDIIEPDIFVMIKASVHIIEERMKNRKVFSRFEKIFSRSDEVKSVENTEIFLKSKNVCVVSTLNNVEPIEQVTGIIVESIIKKRNEKHVNLF